MQYTNTIVISAVNIVSGGTFTILNDFLNQIKNNEEAKNYKIIALVNSHDRLPVDDNIIYKDYKLPKKNWLFRVFYEYIYFFFISLKLKPEIWVSMHDMTPFVYSKYLYTYMHNSSPFFQKREKLKLSFKFKLFVSFYKYIYKINVHRNTAVIVQQNWFREKIAQLCKLPLEKIIVSYPEFDCIPVKSDFEKGRFFFPSFPREFKNFEIICEAAELLKEDETFMQNCEIYLTIDGSENSYAYNIYKKYRDNQYLHFVGLLGKEEMQINYDKCECLIFPSTLETWGLPISEFKPSGKKMILADLPYAYETANNAEKAVFFKPYNANQLAILIKNVCYDVTDNFKPVKIKEINKPFCRNWQDLLEYILKGSSYE
ncbi:MAG: glycosyltransferase [Treponema sp.]|nr:glycosyltransferase [Treponema sp.]